MGLGYWVSLAVVVVSAAAAVVLVVATPLMLWAYVPLTVGGVGMAGIRRSYSHKPARRGTPQ